MSEFGNKWATIALFFTGRTNISVKSRYMLLKRKQEKSENKQKNIPTSSLYCHACFLTSFKKKFLSRAFKTTT